MSKTHSVVITDTSCIIALTNANCLFLLNQIYTNIYTTREVENEFGEPLPEWFTVTSPSDLNLQRKLEFDIDLGEASAIALAIEIQADLIILDDLTARDVAKKLKLNVTGTLGVLVKAKEQGLITHVKPILDTLINSDFRISPELFQIVLEIVKEN